MLYGTPTRAAHRATAGGGLALPLRGYVTTGALSVVLRCKLESLRSAGQHRSPGRPREPQRTAQLLAQGLAALIVLGLTTLIGMFIVADTQRDGSALATPPDPDAAIASRSVDREPLTLREVFPDRGQIRAPAVYRISMTHSDADCRTATVGTLAGLLAEHGCNQVVRAALTAPYADYEVTTGIFNLADAAGAQDVGDRLRGLVETGDGNFATLPANSTGVPTLQVGWRAHGHYLLYCVITGPDGTLLASDDPYAQRITSELVDTYLGELLDQRVAPAGSGA
jgi:hypothetical protein